MRPNTRQAAAPPFRRTLLGAGILLLLLAALAAVGCSSRQARMMDDLAPRTETPAIELERFQVLDPDARQARREEAAPIIASWRDLSHRLADRSAHRLHSWRPAEKSNRWGYGVLAGRAMLRDALGLDPTRADLWRDLARCCDWLGDAPGAIRACAMAKRTLEYAADEDRDGIARDAALTAAWNCRRRGDFAAAEKWLAGSFPEGRGTRESLLLRALLCADRGQVHDARRLADDLGAVEVPINIFIARVTVDGWATRPLGYAQRWIEAMCWLNAGYPDLAWRSLGSLPKRIPELPYAHRYWSDAGLIAEAAGLDHEAWSCYGLAAFTIPNREYIPISGFSCGPLIAGKPSPRVPVYVGPGENLVAGSQFSHAAQLVAECGVEQPGPGRDRKAALATDGLDACIARAVLPDLSLALRGRLKTYMGEDDDAWEDLTRARAAMASAGIADARTSHLLGVLAMRREFGDPAPHLQEAVRLDPALAPAWRALGVVLSERGRDTEAMNAFDRAVSLEPEAVESWYDRGLHHSRCRRWRLALADLNRALRIDPRNEDARDLVAQIQDIASLSAGKVPPAAIPAGPAATAAAVRREFTPEEALLETGELIELEKTLARTGSPADRLNLGRGYLSAGLAERARDLLSPLWPDGLNDAERRLLLMADREMNDTARAAALADGGIAAHPYAADPELWSLAALVCFDAGLEEAGRRALAVATALDPGNSSLRALAELHSGP